MAPMLVLRSLWLVHLRLLQLPLQLLLLLLCPLSPLVAVLGEATGGCSFTTCPVVQTIKFGASAPLSGPIALVGTPVRDGILAAFNEYNSDPSDDQQPIHFVLDMRDDGYVTSVTKQNMASIVDDPSVFGILGAVGTGGIEMCAPNAIQQRNFPFLSAYGGQALRHPFQRNVITVRGSFFDEAATIVHFFVSRGRERIGLFAQNDSFGHSCREGVVTALDSLNLYLHSEGYYTKNMAASYWQDEIALALKNMSSSPTSTLPPNAIVVAAVHEPTSILIRQLHAWWPDTIVVCISSVSVPGLVSLLVPANSTSADAGILDMVYASHFVPNPFSTTSKLAQRFRAAADRINVDKSDHMALEGYLMARLVIAAFQLIPDLNFTQESFINALYEESYFNIDDFRFGPFYPAEIDGGCNQGIRGSHITKVFPNQSLSDVFDFSFNTCGYKPKDWKKLKFGQSCSFTGDTTHVARCLAFRNGLLAAFKQVNDAGGIRGTSRLYLETLDDTGDPKLALLNTYNFLNDPNIFGLVGTSSLGIAETVKLLEKTSGKVLFGAYSGDATLREPFNPRIVNFRASDYDELALIVDGLYYHRGFRRVSVLYENTVFGSTRRDQLEAALGEKRLSIFSEASYESPGGDVKAAVAKLFTGSGSRLQGVVFIGLDDLLPLALEAIHSKSAKVHVYTMSYTDYLADPALLAGVLASKFDLDNLLTTSVVPHPHDSSSDVAKHYKHSLSKLDSTAPVSFAGLEGFIVGQLLTISLTRVMGVDLTAEAMVESLYDIGNFQLDDLRCGPLQIINDNTSLKTTKKSCNQCMKKVFLLEVAKNGSEVFDDDFEFENSCMYVPTKNMDFDFNTTRLPPLILAGFGCAYTLVVMVGMVIWRDNAQIRAVSLEWSLVSCVGALLFYCWIFVLYPIPSDMSCALEPWILDLAFVLLYSPVFAKAKRLDQVVNVTTHKRRQSRPGNSGANAPNTSILKLVSIVLGVFVVYLVVFMIVDRPKMQERYTSEGVRYEDCATKSSAVVILNQGLKVLLVIWGNTICQRIGRLSSRSSHFGANTRMVLSTYHTTFMAVIWFIVEFATVKFPNVRFVCVSLIAVENTVVVVTFLFAYPVYKALKGSEYQEETTGTTSANGIGSNSSKKSVAIAHNSFNNPANKTRASTKVYVGGSGK